jgi:hypothetical protein
MPYDVNPNLEPVLWNVIKVLNANGKAGQEFRMVGRGRTRVRLCVGLERYISV